MRTRMVQNEECDAARERRAMQVDAGGDETHALAGVGVPVQQQDEFRRIHANAGLREHNKMITTQNCASG